jgi:hypothetical protein
MVEWWELNEASGNRVGSHAGMIMTPNNAPGTGAGIDSTIAVEFVSSSSQTLSKANESALQIGDFDFSFAGWIYLTTANYASIFNKWGDGATNEFIVYYDSAAARFRFIMNGGGGVDSVPADTFGAPSTGVWYFLYAEHDATANTMSIGVNAGPLDSISYVGGGAVSTNPLVIGKVDTSNYSNSRVQKVGFWKRKLTAPEQAELYNAGNGATYPF